MPGSRLRRPPGALALGARRPRRRPPARIGMKVVGRSAHRRRSSASTPTSWRSWRTPATTRRLRTTCSSGRTPARASPPMTPTPAAIGRRRRGRQQPQRHDHDPAPRAQRRGGARCRLPRDLWVPIAGTDRSSKINSAYNEGPQRLVATDHPGVRHPDQPLRRDRLRRLPEARGRDRRRRGLHVRPGPGHPLRARASTPAAPSSTDRRPSPTPAAGTTRSGRTATGTSTAPPTSAASSASSCSSARAVEQLLTEMENDPFKVGQLDRRRRRRWSRSTRASIRSRRRRPCARPPRSGSAPTRCRSVGAEHKGQSALDIDEAAAAADPRLLPRHRPGAAGRSAADDHRRLTPGAGDDPPLHCRVR